MSDALSDRFAPRPGLAADEIARLVDAILREATLAEKVGMMSGKGFFEAFSADGRIWGARPYRAGGGLERLAVPALWFTDGPRGVARGQSTCFPCTMARGASFDAGLERRIGEAMAIEIRAQGCNLSGAVCVNLLRHPAWGRAQETYGEDPVHLGTMGSALGQGLQAHNVMATVKHFALNSMENARFTVDVQIADRPLHEVYLPHFRMILEAGIATVMSAYNQVNGAYCGQNRVLLTDILRTEWGFQGFVHSDWVMGVHEPYGAVAGLDIENPEPRVWGDRLIEAVEAGQIVPEVIDQACRRILTTLYRFACAQDPLPDYPESLVNGQAHRALALEAAQASAVLLANDGILPLDPGRVRKLALLGRLASLPNTGDNGSSRVRARHVVTAHEGLTARIGADAILAGDETDLGAAAAAAAAADAVVVVAGYTAREEGEFIPGDLTLGQDGSGRAPIGGDRLDLGLPADQLALIEAAIGSGRPVVVVIVAGSAVLVEPFEARVSAILQTFYAGEAGGTALERLLFGDVSPSGRLPFTVARDPAHYPFFDRDAQTISYDLWHGYPMLLRDGVAPRYGFGHGLSYARFAVRGLKARLQGDAVQAQLSVRNDGAMAASHTILLFADKPGSALERWPRKLVGFSKVHLQPGETQIVDIAVPLQHLRTRESGAWMLEPGGYRLLVADTADGAELVQAMIEL
jgi:beta-glucosidase